MVPVSTTEPHLTTSSQYSRTAHYNTAHLRRQAFYALPQSHWQLLATPPFNILSNLEAVDDAIDANAELAHAIYQSGLTSFGITKAEDGSEPWKGTAKPSDLEKARSTLRQFYRDWSVEGGKEREASFGHVINDLVAERGSKGSSQPFKVLVPGAGLARFVFDLCRLGFNTEGNEISYHMLMGSSYVLNSCPVNMHTIHPWVHSFSNHRSRSRQLASVSVPDVHVASALASGTDAGEMTISASDFILGYSEPKKKDAFDAVATVFFIDTAPNLIRYIETIRHCLKPGGIWTNFGPLLWHWSGFDKSKEGAEKESSITTGIAEPGSVELTEEEVLLLVEKFGFRIEKLESNVECGYIADEESMLRNTYYASHWVARKL